LDDLALDVVGRTSVKGFASRGRTVARVSVEEHMANYQAARAGNSEKVRERGSSAKKGTRKSAVKNGKPKK